MRKQSRDDNKQTLMKDNLNKINYQVRQIKKIKTPLTKTNQVSDKTVKKLLQNNTNVTKQTNLLIKVNEAKTVKKHQEIKKDKLAILNSSVKTIYPLNDFEKFTKNAIDFSSQGTPKFTQRNIPIRGSPEAKKRHPTNIYVYLTPDSKQFKFQSSNENEVNLYSKNLSFKEEKEVKLKEKVINLITKSKDKTERGYFINDILDQVQKLEIVLKQKKENQKMFHLKTKEEIHKKVDFLNQKVLNQGFKTLQRIFDGRIQAALMKIKNV